MIKAVLLDLDGVLTDSNTAYLELFERMFAKHNIRVSRPLILRHFGENANKFFKAVVPSGKYGEICKYYAEQALTPAFFRTIKLFPYSRKTLETLNKKYKLALCTGAYNKTVVYLIKKLRLKKYFKVIITGQDVKKGKPAPDLLLVALKKLEVKLSEAVYVGDAPADVSTARNARLRPIIVLTGVLKKKSARGMGVTDVLSDVSKLPLFLEKLK